MELEPLINLVDASLGQVDMSGNLIDGGSLTLNNGNLVMNGGSISGASIGGGGETPNLEHLQQLL